MPDATEAHVETQIKVRGERREVLTRDTPLQLWVIIAESVLHHRVGSHEVMKAQLEALVEDSRRPNVQLQVLPQDDPMNACLFGPFIIMSFPASSETDIIHAESPTSTWPQPTSVIHGRSFWTP